MPNLTPKLTHLFIATSVALGFSLPGVAFAQEPADSIIELSAADKATHFSKADLDGDERLTEGEYEVFINSLADSGDESAIAVRDTGTYANGFITTDLNGDGVITLEELV